MNEDLRMVPWNRDGFKVGLCAKSPVGISESLLCLTNNTGIGQTTFSTMLERFDKLYSRQFYLHHYTEYIDEASFGAAREDVRQLIDEYAILERGAGAGAGAGAGGRGNTLTRAQPIGQQSV